MGGAIFKCDEGFFYCDPSASACSVERSDGSIELVTAVSSQGARKFRKISWLDEHVEVVAFQALLDGIWLVGGVPTTFQVPDGGSGAEATTFAELIVCSGGTPPYRMDIYDALDMATKACDGDDPSPGGAGERTLVWTPWNKRVPPPPATDPAPDPLIPADDLGLAGEPPRILLQALGIGARRALVGAAAAGPRGVPDAGAEEEGHGARPLAARGGRELADAVERLARAAGVGDGQPSHCCLDGGGV